MLERSCEPRAMTLADWGWGCAGVAIDWALPSLLMFPPMHSLSWLDLILIVARILVSVFAFACAATFGRLASYRRWPTAAEWGAIGAVAIAMAERLPNLDTTITWVVEVAYGPSDIAWTASRWSLGATVAMTPILILAAIRRFRPDAPPWLVSALAMLSMVAIWWGPFAAAWIEQPWPMWLWSLLPGEFWRSLVLNMREVFYELLPLGIGIGTLGAAMLAERRRKVTWRWTEWMAAVALSLLVAVFCFAIAVEIAMWPPRPPPSFFITIAVWLIVACLASRPLARRLFPASFSGTRSAAEAGLKL